MGSDEDRYGHQLGAVIKHRDEEDDNGGKIDEIKHKIFLSFFVCYWF